MYMLNYIKRSLNHAKGVPQNPSADKCVEMLPTEARGVAKGKIRSAMRKIIPAVVAGIL